MLYDDGECPLLLLRRGEFDLQEVWWSDVRKEDLIAGMGTEVSLMSAACWRQSLVSVAMVLAITIWLVPAVPAQDDAARTITILAARCPAGYMGDASADECDDAPMPGVAFRAGRPYTDFFLTARTDAAGIVAFEFAGLPYRGTLRVIEELPPGTARFVANCVDAAGTPLAITYEDFPENVPPIGVADVSVGDTGDVRCDWYNVPTVP
jgi:hypothetical protein